MKDLSIVLWIVAILALSACEKDPYAGMFPGAESHEWR